MCDKVKFGGRKSAVKAARRISNRHNGGGLMRAYQCDDCGGWHLTSAERGISVAIDRASLQTRHAGRRRRGRRLRPGEDIHDVARRMRRGEE